MMAYSTQGTSKSKQKRAKTEVLEVLGGRIVRSIGQTDRHSKVCTVRGPRDRRVRLSPNTAIQFYDVQDRLGYDRPSKAIDWLMKEAKAAIDALDDQYNNAAILMQSASDHGRTSALGLHEFHPYNSSRTSFIGQDYINQTTNYHSFTGLNGATSSILTSNDFINFSVDDHLRNKYQTQGLSLSFNSSQDFSPFGNSCSSNAKEGEDYLPLHIIPSTFDENHLLNCHREPLQSNFSAPFSDQHQSFNYENTTFSSNGISRVSSPYTFIEEEQNQVSFKPTSSTAFLQHYQE